MSVIDYSAADHVGGALQTAETFGEKGGEVAIEADAVIIGAGPSGLVAATVLAEAGLDVVVVEAGRFWEYGAFRRRQSWAAKHLMQEQATRIMTGDAYIPVASGRGVGGGTLVNSAICFRAPEWILDEWVERWGVGYFEASRREALFEEVEQVIGVAPTPSEVAGENSFIAREGFSALGITHGFMPRNAPGCVGLGTCQTGCPAGGKATADLTWLPRFLRAGGRLYADTRAERIDVDGERAKGLEAVMIDPATRRVQASLRVNAERTILAAGAINTPMLLQSQSLANGSGQVGRNLRVHPTCAVIARFPNREVKLWNGATQGYFAHHPHNRDILLETFSASPDVFLAQMGKVGEIDPGAFLRDFRHLAACGLLVRDDSSGRVRRRDDGRAKITYRLGRRDVQKIRAGLYTLIEMFHAAGSRQIRPLVRGSRYFVTVAQARRHVASKWHPSEFSLYSSHPMGTCRIGDDRDSSVVRADDGQCWDVEGLHIVDSSLFPSALGANPQVTIMAQALALAEAIAR